MRRAGRHARVPFTAAQASALEAAFVRAPYLAPPALRALAAALQLRDDRVSAVSLYIVQLGVRYGRQGTPFTGRQAGAGLRAQQATALDLQLTDDTTVLLARRDERHVSFTGQRR